MEKYLNIDGSENVLSVYGAWPSFHDAEITSLSLDRKALEEERGPTATIIVHCFQITSEIVNNQYKTINHNLITFGFFGLVEFELLHGFGSQNSLSGLSVIDVSSEQLENIKYKVAFYAHFNCDLLFKCNKIKVLSVKEGIPNNSVYA